MGLRWCCQLAFRRRRVSKGRRTSTVACECCSHRGLEATNVQVPLWERYFDPGLSQRFNNRDRNFALQLKPRVLMGRPKAKLKIQSALTTSQKESRGWPLTQYFRIGFRHLYKQF